MLLAPFVFIERPTAAEITHCTFRVLPFATIRLRLSFEVYDDVPERIAKETELF